MDAGLPFGRTRITAAEYEELIDSSEIIEHLDTKGVSDPRVRVNEFIESIPDLLAWLEQHGRNYPWRHTTNPWRIYATEILLQRTRADAVADIYEEFFISFPNPGAVVETEEQAIFDVIQSLGFGNQRTQSIREAARLCVEQHDGKVPADLDELKKPWRVGPYSARACLLFAFNTPLALVDANISRIVERVYGYEMPEQPHKSGEVYTFMQALLPSDPAVARSFTFALLDLGALICTEADPRCRVCPLNSWCLFAQQTR